MKIQKMVTLVALLASQNIFAQEIPDSAPIKQSMARFERLNEQCPGGVRNDPNADIACMNRTATEKALQNAGWCYAGGWTKCTTHLSKAQRNANQKAIQFARKGDCNLLSGVISFVPMWRDNGVPIERPHAIVENVLLEIGASPAHKKKWHESILAIYKSRITSDQILSKLRPRCDRMPGSMF